MHVCLVVDGERHLLDVRGVDVAKQSRFWYFLIYARDARVTDVENPLETPVKLVAFPVVIRRVGSSSRHAVRHEPHLHPALGAFHLERIQSPTRVVSSASSLTSSTPSPTPTIRSTSGSRRRRFARADAADARFPILPESWPPPLRPVPFRPDLLQKPIVPHHVRVFKIPYVYERRPRALPVAIAVHLVLFNARQRARLGFASRTRVPALRPFAHVADTETRRHSVVRSVVACPSVDVVRTDDGIEMN